MELIKPLEDVLSERLSALKLLPESLERIRSAYRMVGKREFGLEFDAERIDVFSAMLLVRWYHDYHVEAGNQEAAQEAAALWIYLYCKLTGTSPDVALKTASDSK